MFRKILIANRGEIACRVARTCRDLGVAVAGVHSTADAEALHVREIGESIEIGGAAASDSYLRIDAVVAAARAVRAEAVHPGFGFLAENAGFARAVEAAGLTFIGPTPETIERLGDKASAKREAVAVGIPTIPGSETPSADVLEIERIARRLGLPVMLKAAAGGGGKGMRAIVSFERLHEAIESAMREAKSAFGDAGLIVEKLIQRGRHIEVQIVGDGNGNVVHLFERECSLQRRHQKLIEEAPAANLPSALRERMLQDAVRLAQRLNYRGVGTVEFIVSGDNYYFLEVNPRLQVEHPVTEMVTGIDIVEVMLRVAAGEGLPFAQGDVPCRGHAIEARICAEDPNQEFMPCTGVIAYVDFPHDSVRVETGIGNGSIVTPYYDSMLAKLISCAENRHRALDLLHHALSETSVLGVTTNRDFLMRLVALPETRTATFHTRLIDEQIDTLLDRSGGIEPEILALGAYFWMMHRRHPSSENPWQSTNMTGWHMEALDEEVSPIPILHLDSAGGSAEIRFGPLKPDGTMLIGVNDARIAAKLSALSSEEFIASIDSRREKVRIRQRHDAIFVQTPRGTQTMVTIPYLNHISAIPESSGELRAPLTGIVLKVNVARGDRIKMGDALVVMESMKMELRIASKIDGVVAAVHFKPGDTVDRNAVVAVVAPE